MLRYRYGYSCGHSPHQCVCRRECDREMCLSVMCARRTRMYGSSECFYVRARLCALGAAMTIAECEFALGE